MELVQWLFDLTLELFQMPFTIFGYTMSCWQVFVWSIVAVLVVCFIRRCF